MRFALPLVALLAGPALAFAQPRIDVYEVEITWTAPPPGTYYVDRTPVHVYAGFPPFGFLPATPPAVGTPMPYQLRDQAGTPYTGRITAVRYKGGR